MLEKRTSLKYIQDELNKLQRKPCIAITSAWKTTPTAALKAKLYLTSLHIHIRTQKMQTLSSLATQQKTLKETDHTRIWFKAMWADTSLTMATNKVSKTFRFDSKMKFVNPQKRGQGCRRYLQRRAYQIDSIRQVLIGISRWNQSCHRMWPHSRKC